MDVRFGITGNVLYILFLGELFHWTLEVLSDWWIEWNCQTGRELSDWQRRASDEAQSFIIIFSYRKHSGGEEKREPCWMSGAWLTSICLSFFYWETSLTYTMFTHSLWRGESQVALMWRWASDSFLSFPMAEREGGRCKEEKERDKEGREREILGEREREKKERETDKEKRDGEKERGEQR